MTKKNSFTLALACAALANLSAQAQSTVAYDNKTGFQNAFTSRGDFEMADEIYLSNGTPVTITQFSFEYTFENNNGGSTPTATFRIYDKVGNLPGGVLAGSTSQTFSLASDGNGTITSRTVTLDLNVTDSDGTIIWAVDFDGISGADAAGLRFYNGVPQGTTAGQSLDDHWENSGSVATPFWALVNNAGLVDNFGATVTIVPEPGTIGLFVGGVALLGLAARRRKA